MSADKNLFTPVAILTAACFRSARPEEVTKEAIMETFDEIYDALDCYGREKNEREPMNNIREWLESFYGKD